MFFFQGLPALLDNSVARKLNSDSSNVVEVISTSYNVMFLWPYYVVWSIIAEQCPIITWRLTAITLNRDLRVHSWIWSFKDISKLERRSSCRAGGAVIKLRAMEAYKRKNRYQYTYFCLATMLASTSTTEIVENHSESSGCANSCNKFCFKSIFINH